MIGEVYRSYISEGSRLFLYQKDIDNLEKGVVIQCLDISHIPFEIPFILVQLTDQDFSIDYYPKNFSSVDITTCWIKLNQTQFDKFLTNKYLEFNGINFSFLQEDDS